MKFKNIGETIYIKGRIGWKGLKKKEYLNKSDYRIINGQNIINNRIDWGNCGYITKQRYEESPEIMLQPNDILITKDGTIGKVAMVKELSLPTTVASGIFVLRNCISNVWDTNYLYYFFQSFSFKKFIHSRVEGSVIPHLYQKDFMQLNINCPDISVQKSISYKLKLIDEQITLNNRINDNLVA